MTSSLVRRIFATVFIRYFARMDESELGRLAEAYCGTLVDTGLPVRLISTVLAELQHDGRGRSSSIWDRRRELLITPMDGADYVNVVCSSSEHWMTMRTDGVRNILLLGDVSTPLSVSTFASLSAAMHGAYEVVFAPSVQVVEAVEKLTGKRPDHLPPVSRASAERLLLAFQAS